MFFRVAGVVACLTLVGCDIEDKNFQFIHDSHEMKYQVTCIDGVAYYIRGTRMAVAVKRDSTVKLCEMPEQTK